MGSTVCSAGPFFIVGSPDYDAPKRAVVDALRAIGVVNINNGEPWEWGDGCDSIAIATTMNEYHEYEYLEFYNWPKDMLNKFNDAICDPYDQRYFENELEVFEQLVRDINNYKDWAESYQWRTHNSGSFTGGGKWFMHAGEDYGSYGNEVGDISNALYTKWFALTGWKSGKDFELKECDE